MSHGGMKRNQPYGVVVEFDDPDKLIQAANRALDAGYSKMDAFTPFPVHGLPEAIGFKEAKVPWIVFWSGVMGAVGGLALQIWVSKYAYPHNIGGRPLDSWPNFVPPMFETTVLFAALSAVFSMILLNKLPQPHHPIFDAPNFARASQDRFFLLVEVADPNFNIEETPKFLKTDDALNVSMINAEEEGDW